MADPNDPAANPLLASEDGNIFGAGGGMNPDHPLLARAQALLKSQLETNKQRLEEELREKQNALKVSGLGRACSPMASTLVPGSTNRGLQ